MKADEDDKNTANKKDSEQHKPEHRVLLLDHCCDNCGALIVGKRIHCEHCEDYDLCRMCHKMLDISIDTDEDLTEELSSIQQPTNTNTINRIHLSSLSRISIMESHLKTQIFNSTHIYTPKSYFQS